eukprot:1603591-Pyramimonas_sp.AAC.5
MVRSVHRPRDPPAEPARTPSWTGDTTTGTPFTRKSHRESSLPKPSPSSGSRFFKVMSTPCMLPSGPGVDCPGSICARDTLHLGERTASTLCARLSATSCVSLSTLLET